MIILLIPVVLIILSGICFFIEREDVGAGFFISGVTTALMLGISCLISYYAAVAQVEQFRATEATYTRARKTGVGIEKAAIQVDIAEMNRWLAGAQYWNSTILDPFWPDIVDDLKPIE